MNEYRKCNELIEPMDDFWEQMLDELENTTSEEW